MPMGLSTNLENFHEIDLVYCPVDDDIFDRELW